MVINLRTEDEIYMNSKMPKDYTFSENWINKKLYKCLMVS